MARRLTNGFELQSVTANVEGGDANSTTPLAISTSIFHGTSGTVGGLAALQMNVTVAAQPGWDTNFTPTATPISSGYARVYLYIGTAPSAAQNLIFDIYAGGASAVYFGLTLSSALVLQGFYTANGTTGNAVTGTQTLSLSTWYYIELFWNGTTGTWTTTYRVNGVQLSSTTFSATAGGLDTVSMGMAGITVSTLTLANVTGNIYFDDLVVNDTTGSFQNTWAGAGYLARATPNATGDANGFATVVGGTAGATNNFTRVDELTPDNATTYNASNTANAQDLFKVSTPTIPAGATVNGVFVGVRIANITAADVTTALEVQAEQQASGTIASSSAIAIDTTTWETNAKAVPRLLYPLNLYQDPTSTNWTLTTIGSMQIGYKLTTAHTDTIGISTVWAYVDYTPSSGVNATVTQVGATLTATGGTQSVATVNDVSLSQAAATLTTTTGTQAVTSIQNVAISQSAATLTATTGTQIVQTRGIIAQAGATLTAAGGTQTVATVNIVNITQVAATLTVTGGSQGIQDIQDVQITQVGATLTVAGGTQSIATVNNVSISQVKAVLTASGGTQVIAASNYVAISQVKATLTATGGTQAVATLQQVSISQVGVTISATGGTQSIVTTNIVAISQSHATLTVTGGTQAVTTSLTANISQVAANITASGGSQTVAGHRPSVKTTGFYSNLGRSRNFMFYSYS